MEYLLYELGIGFRDRAYIIKLTNFFKKEEEFNTYMRIVTKNLDRDYSTIRKRVKKIIYSADEDNLNKIGLSKRTTGKNFIKTMFEKNLENNYSEIVEKGKVIINDSDKKRLKKSNKKMNAKEFLKKIYEDAIK